MTASNTNCPQFRASHAGASVRWPTVGPKILRKKSFAERRRAPRIAFPKETAMSKEKPTDDPRNESDWANTRQTDQPWKGLPEKDQRPNKTGKPDLERWKDSGTH